MYEKGAKRQDGGGWDGRSLVIWKMGKDLVIIATLFEDCSIGCEQEEWWGQSPRILAVTIAQVTEAWIKAGAAEMMKSRNIRDINQSRRDMLCQPILLSWFHSLPPSVLPSWKTNQPLSFARAGSDCQLGCEGCSHLEWIPHAAQWEAEPSLYCSVSSTLHQNCFVCHQVIKVVDCSAASGNVVLKLGQQSLSLQ